MRAGSTWAIPVFVPGSLDLWMYRGTYNPMMTLDHPRVALALLPSPSQLAIGRWGWGFHNMWDSLNPGELDFGLQVVGIVNVWRNF